MGGQRTTAGKAYSRPMRAQPDPAAPGQPGGCPEIAARAHLEWLPLAVQQVMDESGQDLDKVDAIAATTGPGLIGGLTVGTSFAKSLSLASGKPFVAVNHLAGHALSLGLSHDLRFPYLLLLVSGGHCQVLAVEGVGRYRRWGTTIDDAVGEAFDKVGRLLDLPYPGGPHLKPWQRMGTPRPLPCPARYAVNRAATSLFRVSKQRFGGRLNSLTRRSRGRNAPIWPQVFRQLQQKAWPTALDRR